MSQRHILTYRGPDQPGIVARTMTCLFEQGANVEEAAQYHDTATAKFFARTVFAVDDDEQCQRFATAFEPLAGELELDWTLTPSAHRMRVVILVSRMDHCLNDLLHRWRSGTLAMDIPAVISNHPDLEELVAWHGIPFHYLPVGPAGPAGPAGPVGPVDPDARAAQHERLMALLASLDADLVVLARYMQILPPALCEVLAGRCINIHHSFLPSFKGARPYHAAFERGVKLIGATAHYVTPELDEGPIIDQDVRRVTHAHTAAQLMEIGRDIECAVLARSLRWHLERRIQIDGAKTVVFE